MPRSIRKNLYDDTPGYEVMYHSGDVARFLPDGNIQIIGRKDSQVKIRGFRIELSEVEEVIRRYEGIRDATVVAFDDPMVENILLPMWYRTALLISMPE